MKKISIIVLVISILMIIAGVIFFVVSQKEHELAQEVSVEYTSNNNDNIPNEIVVQNKYLIDNIIIVNVGDETNISLNITNISDEVLEVGELVVYINDDIELPFMVGIIEPNVSYRMNVRYEETIEGFNKFNIR